EQPPRIFLLFDGLFAFKPPICRSRLSTIGGNCAAAHATTAAGRVGSGAGDRPRRNLTTPWQYMRCPAGEIYHLLTLRFAIRRTCVKKAHHRSWRGIGDPTDNRATAGRKFLDSESERPD